MLSRGVSVLYRTQVEDSVYRESSTCVLGSLLSEFRVLTTQLVSLEMKLFGEPGCRRQIVFFGDVAKSYNSGPHTVCKLSHGQVEVSHGYFFQWVGSDGLFSTINYIFFISRFRPIIFFPFERTRGLL